ncbi:MAG: HlyC/CorC family transporter [Lachnospiraceae bacterium]
MDTIGVIQIIILIILLLLSGFFSSSETALTMANRVKIRSLADEQHKNALILQKVYNNTSKMLSTILIGNNIVNIVASSLTTSFAIGLGGSVAIGLATGILTMLILLFGEIVPKTLASLHAEKIALSYAPIIFYLMYVLTPLIFIIDKLSNFILRLLHIDPNKKTTMTELELKTYVDVSHEDGVIESEEREMIYNVFDFSDTVAKDIMIPRIDMATINETATYDELMTLFRDCMYTRIPVYKEEKDNIIGLVNIKDFILVNEKETFCVSDIIRDAYYTYEYKKTADLMLEMREKLSNVCFVLNEYGACVGMITLEDLLEEIVGEIRDEYDADEEEFIKELDHNCYLIEGAMKLDDVNSALGTNFQSEDYDSIGGLVIEILDRMPEINDEVETTDHVILKVESASQNRILKVLCTLPEQEVLHDDFALDSVSL